MNLSAFAAPSLEKILLSALLLCLVNFRYTLNGRPIPLVA
jgi:hypothetical protein